MFKRKISKAAAIISAIWILAFLIFYFTRPLVAFFTGPMDKSYIDNLSKPGALTFSYRTKVVRNEDSNILKRSDLIINHSVLGLDYENTYDMVYDPTALVNLAELGSDFTYLYDETDSIEAEFLEYLNESGLRFNAVPFSSTIARSEYALYRERTGEGLILTLSLDKTIGFIRSLENARLAITYLDYAALEIRDAEIVFTPEWDSIIRENLQKGF